MSAAGPIEDYLDELVRRMAGAPPRQLRELLAETESHLRDHAADGIARGLTADTAEAEAVLAMGAVADLVGDELSTRPWPALTRRVVASGLWLGSIGAVTVGLSGVLAALVRWIWGASALVDVAPGQVLSARDCARWLAGAPTTTSCRTAAIGDWTWEIVGSRLFAGVVGLLGLAVYVGVRRRWSRSGRWFPLPRQVSATIGVVAFGAAAAWSLGNGVDLLVIAHGNGSGQWLSAAPVAAFAALWFAVLLVRELRGPTPP